MDDSLFKSVCEGTAQTTRLFQDGVTEIQMNVLIMITANTFPSIKIDSGVVRRIKSHTCIQNHQHFFDWFRMTNIPNSKTESPTLFKFYFQPNSPKVFRSKSSELLKN